MLFTVHRAERADTLVEALAEQLRVPAGDAFEPEVISVPAKGVERWLAQQLSTSLGITANVAFPHPNQLVEGALAAVQGIDPDDDPWAPGGLVWTVLRVIDDCLDEPWCALLADHLGAGEAADSHRRGRRYSTADMLARLFTGYGENRPGMLVDWAAGRDTDGAGAGVHPDLAWQAELWRRLRERIGSPSPAERLTDACERLVAEPALVELPARASLFGATRLTSAQLDVLAALAAHRDIHLWLTHPSPAMWEELADQPAPLRRAEDDSAAQLNNPLLVGLSRDVRELQHRLTGRATDIHHPGRDVATGTLAAVRADIAAERAPGSQGRVPHDGTIQIHACHGSARQVEVLREALLGLLAADETLQPRDIVVMCPDVDTFAPLIAAAFGEPDSEHPGHRLRVRLADRGLTYTNPLLEMVSTVLRLADGRVTASEVLDLAASEPVARRFGFAADELETMRTWTATAGARWGLSQRQRAAHGLDDVRQNTFATALDRLLLGVAADETDLEWLGLALPLDDVDSSDVDLAGRFAEFVDRLTAVLAKLGGEQPAGDWTATLSRALDLLTDVGADAAWQRVQADRELATATEHAAGGAARPSEGRAEPCPSGRSGDGALPSPAANAAPSGLVNTGDVRLRLADVRSMLARHLAARPTRANFRTGELTVCTLVPMRSVPHRVVAVIGLDDEVFPRAAHADGDDILARDPCVGERDPRSEDRQLLLDATIAATEHLLVCYTGADPVTGADRPPAAPLAELIDAVRATVTEPDEVVTRQPLQPFDAANFTPPAPFSFDAHAHAGAHAAQRPEPATGFLPDPLPGLDLADIDLSELVAFHTNPARGFLRQRLGVTVWRPDEEPDDALPLAVAGLARWEIGDRMLSTALAGADLGYLRQAELRRGTLPAGKLGTTAVGDIADSVAVLRDAAAPYLEEPAATIDVSVDLTGGRRLTGTVPGVRGQVLLTASYGALSPKQRLTAWLRLLAVAATTGGTDWQAVTIAPARSGAQRARRSTLSVPPNPREVLEQLVDLYDRGLREPVPLAPKTSERYASRRGAGASVDEARADAEDVWTSTMERYGENDDDAIRYAHPPGAPFETLWQVPPAADERWCDEPTRFGVFARRVWDPLLAAEEVAPV